MTGLQKFITALFLITVLIVIYFLWGNHESCPSEGSARQINVQELNRLKNRSDPPLESDFDGTATMEQMLAPGNDRRRWSEYKAAELVAYVYDVKVGGKETCNCEAGDPEDRDTHIELVIDPMHYYHSNKVIVEVSPRLRKKMAAQGLDWSSTALRDKILGRWVKVKGWMLFDFEHAGQADHTNPRGERNWRATAWEIHPVTSIEVVDRPI